MKVYWTHWLVGEEELDLSELNALVKAARKNSKAKVSEMSDSDGDTFLVLADPGAKTKDLDAYLEQD